VKLITLRKKIGNPVKHRLANYVSSFDGCSTGSRKPPQQ